jgi:hypothetical protein
MQQTVRIRPRFQLGPLRRERAARRQPERHFVGRMQVERAAQRPRLHQPAVAPERVADVLLRDAVDTRGQLQLGRGLHLRVDAADATDDVDEVR